MSDEIKGAPGSWQRSPARLLQIYAYPELQQQSPSLPGGIPTQFVNVLCGFGINTLEELRQFSGAWLRKQRGGLGPRAVEAIERALADAGFALPERLTAQAHRMLEAPEAYLRDKAIAAATETLNGYGYAVVPKDAEPETAGDASDAFAAPGCG